MKHTSTLAIAIIPGLLLFSVATGAVEIPQLKPGLWETRAQYSSDTKGAEGSDVDQVCEEIGEQIGARQFAEDDARKNCSKNETRRESGKWVTDRVCKTGGTTMSSHIVTDAGSDNAYHTVMNVTYAPPMAGRSRTSTTIDGKWLGACK